MDEKFLEKILEDHQRWINDCGGSQANLDKEDLYEANLRGVILCAASLYKANLCGADLKGANLRKANLREADLSKANLNEVNLSEANLFDANLFEAYLPGANLYSADLREADLREANLRGANLCKADLRRTDLRGADLLGADLRGANLCGTYLDKKIVQVGPIGSRSDYTVYHVDEDIVQCGCWKKPVGRSLAEFIERIDRIYPEDDKDNVKYRRDYLAAIAMFQVLREYYLKN